MQDCEEKKIFDNKKKYKEKKKKWKQHQAGLSSDSRYKNIYIISLHQRLIRISTDLCTYKNNKIYQRRWLKTNPSPLTTAVVVLTRLIVIIL